MDPHSNISSIDPVDHYWVKEWLAVNGSFLFRKCLIYFEIVTALISLVINSLVMITILIWNSASCRGYFYGLLNLTLAQCLISLTSLVGVICSLWILDSNTPPSESKDKWWRSALHNIIFAVFSGVSVTGGAAISWTHWWSLNVSANHVEMPSGYRVIKIMFYVLWFTTMMFATWFNSSLIWRAALTTTIAANDERALSPYLQTYSMTLFISTFLLLFSNLTSIPPVVGHLTTRAIQGVHQHDCGDADCICSDSEVDRASIKSSRWSPLPNFNLKQDNHPLKLPPIPKIVTLHDDSNPEMATPITMDREENVIQVENLKIQPYDKVLSAASSVLNIPTPCSLSMYSADISTNSVPETLTVSPLKLSIERLHQRLQRLNNTRPQLPLDAESPDDSSPTRTISTRKRVKKKRKSSKKLRSVKRLQFERPSHVQITVMASFIVLYFSIWFLLLIGKECPDYSNIILSVCRLLINIISTVNPLVQGFRHPRFALRIIKSWRKAHPSISNSIHPTTITTL